MGSSFPIRSPDGAVDVHTRQLGDDSSQQMSFFKKESRGRELVVDDIERKLQELNYKRCDAQSGVWTDILVATDGGTVAERRMARFYRVEGKNQMAMVFGKSSCAIGEAVCSNNYYIRLSDIPSSLTEAGVYLRGLCNKGP